MKITNLYTYISVGMYLYVFGCVAQYTECPVH